LLREYNRWAVIKMKKNGFTLVEVIVAMAVGALIMAAVYGFMTLVQKNSANADRRIVTQQDTRMVLDLMASEISMASYSNSDAANVWSNASLLACITNFDKTCKGIKSATANSIAVAMNLNGGAPNYSTTIGDVENEYIVYSYDGASTLTRSVNCVGAAILGGSAPYTNVSNAKAGPGNTPVPMFRYYDGTNTLISAPVSTANIPNIRRILITIVADTAEKDVSTQQYKRMVYSTSVMVRNHGFGY
jgi:prepilin-type N-terminal cleavage/methylation domain-containing protein